MAFQCALYLLYVGLFVLCHLVCTETISYTIFITTFWFNVLLWKITKITLEHIFHFFGVIDSA